MTPDPRATLDPPVRKEFKATPDLLAHKGFKATPVPRAILARKE